VWLVTETKATCLLHASGAGPRAGAVIVDLSDRAIVIERLRHQGVLRCRAGDISGVEPLVPEGLRSFVVATGPSPDASFAVLVMGWDTPEPPWDETAVSHLRIAAGLLHRALANQQGERLALPDAIVGSLADSIVAVGPDGTIIAVNAAWTACYQLHRDALAERTGAGANYFDICRASSHGSPDVESMLRGVQAVVHGDAPFFQTAYPYHGPGGEQWYVVTATPLQGQSGGAVVAHSVVTPENVKLLARRIGERMFHRLTDAIPVPIWIVAPDGRLVHGNQRWIELADAHHGRAAGSRTWMAGFHPDDRRAARAAFRAAVARGETFNLELRVQAGDGTYRWSACIGAPHVAVDGQLEGYVVFCCDISAKRQAEWAFTEVSSKLVAAQEAERSRIGRELHDDLGQQAALLAVKLETLARDARLSRTRLRAGVVEAEENLQELAVAIHSLSHELHPAKLKLLGLARTLEALARDASQEGSVEIRFTAHDVPPDIPELTALCVFRVAQEALQNAVKHSGAHHISVELTAAASQLTLLVTDTGRGFDPLNSESTGIGLLTMRERVEMSGGRLRIDTTHASGTTIEVTLPLGQSDRVM
jgi:PAS domain S-box-containing protein